MSKFQHYSTEHCIYLRFLFHAVTNFRGDILLQVPHWNPARSQKLSHDFHRRIGKFLPQRKRQGLRHRAAWWNTNLWNQDLSYPSTLKVIQIHADIYIYIYIFMYRYICIQLDVLDEDSAKCILVFSNKQGIKEPTNQPNKQGIKEPTNQPNKQGIKEPTNQPNKQGIKEPTNQPNKQESNQPTKQTNKQTNKHTHTQ